MEQTYVFKVKERLQPLKEGEPYNTFQTVCLCVAKNSTKEAKSMTINNGDALERYIEFAKPYKLIISSEFPDIYPVLALKIEHNGEWYGNSVLVRDTKDEKVIKEAINYLKEEIEKILP